MSRKDYTGQTFNYLTAIKKTGKIPRKDKRFDSIWLWRCKCGKEVEILARSVLRNYRKSCGCHVRRGEESLAYNVYIKSYNDGDLSFEEFKAISQQPCYWCGDAELKNHYRRKQTSLDCYFHYNGIGRIDHTKPHSKDNIVGACCWDCNQLQSNMDADQFWKWIEKIYLNRKAT